MIFDKVYCITTLNAKDRRENLINSLTGINCINKKNFKFIYSNIIPESIINVLNKINIDETKDFIIHNKRLLSYMINIYTLIKNCYDSNLNNIMLLEDDITFIDDKKLINKVFDNIPLNYNCFKFTFFDREWVNGGLKEKREKENTDYILINDEYYKKLFSGSAAGYCLDKNGMKEFIDLYDKMILLPGDEIFNYLNKYYIPLYDISYLDEKKFKSTIW